MNLYAFIAVTHDTLNQLSNLLQADCNTRQQKIDQRDWDPGRRIDVRSDHVFFWIRWLTGDKYLS
jgi:hypothetical protein